ncbi:MAG: alginate lyase family protein [Steroidobacteraceae bacterium]
MQSLQWYFSRLARMSAAEIAHRAGNAARLGLRRLGWERTAPVPEPDESLPGAAFLSIPASIDAAGYIAAADRILAGRFDLFNLHDRLLGFPPEWNRDPLSGRLAPMTHGRLLDYRDERLVGNIKYLWEPSRHLHLVTLAQAYALTRNSRYASGIRHYLQSWLSSCPYPLGPHWSSSLELGIRLINWSLTWQLIGGSDSELFHDAEGKQLKRAWLASIHRHTHSICTHLSRYSSANNHLIGEACGVWIAATTWPFWPEMARHGEQCRAILEAEMLSQNAQDGGNREQAFSYQQFVLDFLLLAALAGRASGHAFSTAYWARLEAMTRFIAAMLDVAGNMPMIGDADDGYVTQLSPESGFRPFVSLVATGALLLNDSALARKAGTLDDKTRWLAGPDSDLRFEQLRSQTAAGKPSAQSFPDSGYYLLGSDFDSDDEVRMLIDAGPLGYLSIAAHGHADALSFTLNAGGTEILIDPGTYAYHTEPEWRRYFRSTRAHNTVEIDGDDQSIQRGNFMWTKHAAARCLEFHPQASSGYFVGEHDGYARLPDPVRHRREIRHIRHSTDRHEITITDTLFCSGQHRVARHWHFAEDRVISARGDLWHTRAGRFAITIRPLEPLGGSLLFHGGSAAEGGWVSRSFGQRVPAPTLRWDSKINGDTVLRTLIEVTTT